MGARHANAACRLANRVAPLGGCESGGTSRRPASRYTRRLARRPGMTELAIGFWVAVVVLGGVLSVLGSRYEKAPETAGKGPRLGLAVELAATPVAFAELVGAA